MCCLRAESWWFAAVTLPGESRRVVEQAVECPGLAAQLLARDPVVTKRQQRPQPGTYGLDGGRSPPLDAQRPVGACHPRRAASPGASLWHRHGVRLEELGERGDDVGRRRTA